MALRPCRWPRCGALVVRGYCPTHAARQEHLRPNVDVRRWYHTERWRTLAAQVRREEPWCPDCLAEGRRVRTTDVDHRVPHRGDPRLFWDRQNLGGKCHSHHSIKTQRERWGPPDPVVLA
jgi:5-methylcytosine-specific restriction protein A